MFAPTQTVSRNTGDTSLLSLSAFLNAIVEAKKQNCDVVIVDTAGRLAVDEEMMAEIKKVRDAISPNETLFVVDSMTGQDAVNTAKAF